MVKRKAKTAVRELESFCQKSGNRITAPREYVLEIIASSDKPMTAYDVLHELANKLDRPKPPTAYRALEFLMQYGFIHRIESLNAYVACTEDHKHHSSQYLICETCKEVDEIHLCKMPDSLKAKVTKKRFSVNHWNAEIHGVCSKCS